MKTKSLSFYAIALLAFTLSACSDDEEAPATDNHFSVNTESFPLQSGSIRSIQTETHPSTNATVYEWDIMLSSGTLDDKKHWVRFILNSSNSNDVPTGTYVYDEGYADHNMDDYTYYITSIMRNADTEESEEGDLFANTVFKTGTVTVGKSGSNYNVSFDILLDDGTTSSGQFTGPLTLREPVLPN